MATSTTRRDVLTGAGSIATIFATSINALSANQDFDTALLALREPFNETWRAYEAALAAQSDAEGKAWSRRRAEPHADPKTLDAEEGLTAALAWVERTDRANRTIVERMCELPARTIEGLAFKAKVSLEHEDNRMEELVTSIMDDILAMGGAHA